MIRNTKVFSIQPRLEELEDRIQPSFIFAGGITQLEAPVGKVVADMNTTVTKLTTDISAIKSATTTGGAEGAFANAAADYQRLWNDHNTVTVFVTADIALVNFIAMTEFTESGDIVDLAILKIPFFTNFFNPFGTLNNDLSQANSIWNSGNLTGTNSTDITTPGDMLNTLLSTTQTIQQSASAPSFS
jgi:hypothetical protein